MVNRVEVRYVITVDEGTAFVTKEIWTCTVTGPCPKDQLIDLAQYMHLAPWKEIKPAR